MGVGWKDASVDIALGGIGWISFTGCGNLVVEVRYNI
jgi:hypothetical protein